MDLIKLKDYYYSEIMDTLKFWEDHSYDEVNGGFLTYMTEDGSIWGTEKSVWAQGRGMYIFSYAYNNISKNAKWLEMAKKTYSFMTNKCFNEDGRMPFIVTKEGIDFQSRRYFYSETFYVIGCMELFKATGDVTYFNSGIDVYHRLLDLYNGITKTTPKFNQEVFKAISLATPMILLSTTQIVRENDLKNSSFYDEIIAKFFKEIKLHYRDGLLLENVQPDGSDISGPKGRVINPGHSIECSWFIMNEYKYNHNNEYLEFALSVLEHSYDFGWDKEFGGIYAFLDILGYPSEALEWDMKLWWPQTETMIAFIDAYTITKDSKYLDLYNTVHEYSFSHFKDNLHKEWYGYLHRDGSVANTCKGNLFKGPFHLPRMLMLNYGMLKELTK